MRCARAAIGRWAAALWLSGASLLLAGAPASAFTGGEPALATPDLPREARETLARVERGGPYRYDRDGVVFGNRERRLPLRERGYYREYTVQTPGVRHRGARRLVVGCERAGASARAADGAGSPWTAFRECAGPADVYYTDDHYRSFRRVLP